MSHPPGECPGTDHYPPPFSHIPIIPLCKPPKWVAEAMCDPRHIDNRDQD